MGFVKINFYMRDQGLLLLDVGGQKVKDLMVNGVKLSKVNKNERFIEIPE